jgi:hypothetical protein
MGGVHLKDHKLQQILAGESEQQMKEVFFFKTLLSLAILNNYIL